VVQQDGKAEERRRGAAVEEREAKYRREQLDHLLAGMGGVEGAARAALDEVRERWMGPQCAVLDFLLARLKAQRRLAPKDLEPFLEIGAFTAHLSGYLATTHGMRGYCGDLDCEVVKRSFSEVFPRLGLNASNLTAVRANAACLDFANDSLGLVFCFSTLHHLDDPVRCLKEIRRVLRPGGVFLCAREPIQP